MSSSSVLVRDAVNDFLPVGASFTPTTGRLVLPTRRIIELGGGKARFYDVLFGQVATETLTAKTPSSSLIKFSPVHREALGFLLDPSIRNSFLKDLSKAKGWTLKGSKLIGKDKLSTSTIQFDRFNRITGVRLQFNKSIIQDWQFQYVSPTEIAKIPQSARVVPGLTERPVLPEKTNGKSVFACEKIWSGMARLNNVTVKSVTNRGTHFTKIKTDFIQETSASGSWEIGGSRQKIAPKGKPAIQSNLRIKNFANELVKAKIEPSPLAINLINRRIPFLDLFKNANWVKLSGTVKIKGKSYFIVTLSKLGANVTITAEENTGRISDLRVVSSNTSFKSNIKMEYSSF